MDFHVQNLIHEIAQDEPGPAAANALQEGLGGQFGEMRTMMQYLFQSMNFRGAAAKPYRDLIQGIGTEEISHVELIGTTISRLLDGSPRYNDKPTDPPLTWSWRRSMRCLVLFPTPQRLTLRRLTLRSLPRRSSAAAQHPPRDRINRSAPHPLVTNGCGALCGVTLGGRRRRQVRHACGAKL